MNIFAEKTWIAEIQWSVTRVGGTAFLVDCRNPLPLNPGLQKIVSKWKYSK